jgi:hypothetical protein
MPNIANPEAFQLEAATILAAAYSAFPLPGNQEAVLLRAFMSC